MGNNGGITYIYAPIGNGALLMPPWEIMGELPNTSLLWVTNLNFQAWESAHYKN